MCWASAPKPGCRGSYTTDDFFLLFSAFIVRGGGGGGGGGEGPVGIFFFFFLFFVSALAHFEALDPPSCLPFGDHRVTEEVTARPEQPGCSSSDNPFILVGLDALYSAIY